MSQDQRFSRLGPFNADKVLKDLRDLQEEVKRLTARVAELEKKNG